MNWNFLILTLIVFGSSSCSDNTDLNLQEAANHANAARSADLVRTQDDLLAWLQQRYGPVEVLPFQAIFESGVDNRVDLQFRLEDGRILTIPIVYTVSGERLLAEDFDLGSFDSLDSQSD